MVLLLTSCQGDLAASEENYYISSYVNVSYYESTNENLAYETKFIDGHHYLFIDDYIDLANEINEETARIDPLTPTFYEEGLMTVKYRTDNIRSNLVATMTNQTDFRLKASGIEVFESEIKYDLKTYGFRDYIIDEMVYLPLDSIRYVIYNMETPIVRKDRNEYVILGDYQYSFADQEIQPPYLKRANNYESDLDLKHDLRLLKYHLNGLSDSKELSEYNDYFIDTFMLIDSQKDYHSSFRFNSQLFDENPSQTFKDILNNSYLKELNAISSKLQMKDDIFYIVNDDVAYLNIESFAIEEEYFRAVVNRFIAELSNNNHKKVIIDLRNNLGGLTSNLVYLMSYLLDDEFIVRQDVYANHQKIARQILTFHREKRNINNYNITVIVNENSMSASVKLGHLIKTNLEGRVVGVEPRDKQTGVVTLYQSLTGNLIYNSNNKIVFLDSHFNHVDNSNLVDVVLEEEDVEKFLIANKVIKTYTLMDGTYKLNIEGDGIIPTLTIEDGEFIFSYDPLSSYLSIGSYTVADNLLRLTTYDKKYHYVFKLEEDGLVFQRGLSSALNITDKRLVDDIEDQAEFLRLK